MRIIEEHHKNENEVVCGNCGSKLAYYPSDYVGEKRGQWETVIEKLDSSSFFGNTEIIERCPIYRILKCPICDHEIECDKSYIERKLSG